MGIGLEIVLWIFGILAGVASISILVAAMSVIHEVLSVVLFLIFITCLGFIAIIRQQRYFYSKVLQGVSGEKDEAPEGPNIKNGTSENLKGIILTEEEIAAGWRISPLGDKYKEDK
ncbi:MAG: hypothetical protein GY774_40820 [Planctomycetes bacterium]|nr:hypothetical protein [Planctomycetota bacterium]